MKYVVRIERMQDIISVAYSGTVIWSAGGVDEKRAGVSSRVVAATSIRSPEARITGFDGFCRYK